MKQNGNNTKPYVYLSTYIGGGPLKLARFIGAPCLVYEAVSAEWEQPDIRSLTPDFSFALAGTAEVPVLVLEVRVKNCFHYVLMDLTDPALRDVLNTWVQNCGFVVMRGMAEGVNLSKCDLQAEGADILKAKCQNTHAHNPVEFLRYTESLLETKTVQTIAALRMNEQGHEEEVTPVVEVQVLESAEIQVDGDAHEVTEAADEQVFDAGYASQERSFCVPTTFAPIGMLETASDFADTSESASAMNPDTPVLVSTVDLERFLDLARVEGTFGFGHFQFAGRIVLSMRYQSGAAQIYWLADSADPSVWAAIDVIKRNGEVGFLFEDGSHGAFVRVELPPNEEDIRVLWQECLDHPGGLSGAAADLVGSGVVEASATTDIPGIELQYVHVNLLASESILDMLEAMLEGVPDSVTQSDD